MAQQKKRTQAELIEQTFRYMWRMGDLVPAEVSIPLQTGGVFTKQLYRVIPNRR